MIYSHITDSIEKTVGFWNNTMKEKCVDFNENHAEYDDPKEKIGTRLMTIYIDYSYYERIHIFHQECDDIGQKLFEIIQNKDKIEYIQKELIELKKEYSTGTFSVDFPLYSYLSEMPSEKLPYYMFYTICTWQKRQHILSKIHNEMQDHEFEELLDLNSSGYEVMHSIALRIHILQANFKVLQSEGLEVHTLGNEKEYSLVFDNNCSKELFIFCISEYDKSDITKTLISKYFNLFAGKGYIIEKYALKVFYQFVKSNFSLNMKRIESYTSSDLDESIRFKSLESNFIKNKKISSII